MRFWKKSLLPPPAAQPDSLPCSSSPTLQLVHPTALEKQQTWLLNGSAWRAALSFPSYLRREAHLASQPLCLDGALTFWILVDSMDTAHPRVILASCESLRKPALVARADQAPEEVVSHAIGAVFCRDEHRGRGYAGRMMEELSQILETWQQTDGRRSKFNVLYSDIGKQFYSKRGWLPHPSSHISLPKGQYPFVLVLPQTRPLFADDVASLCDVDEVILRKSLTRPFASTLSSRVAILATSETMKWHHAREDFTAKELGKWLPNIKGAIHETAPGSRVWAIWTRTFGQVPRENVLHILRIVVEDTRISGSIDEENMCVNEEEGPRDDMKLLAVAAILQRAREEAMGWNMRCVEVWNPSSLVQKAAKILVPAVSLIHRDQESIASLKWYGEKSEVEWLINEKFAWY